MVVVSDLKGKLAYRQFFNEKIQHLCQGALQAVPEKGEKRLSSEVPPLTLRPQCAPQAV
jgi:hypothetical protein